MRGCRIAWIGLVLFLVCGALSPAFGQTKGTFLPDKLKYKTKKKSGWFPNLDASFNFSFSQSDGVVGVPDGTTLSFGLQLDAGLIYSSGPHEWRNRLLVIHTQTKIPTINSFLKSADKLDLESTYTYRFVKWFGLFGSARLEMPLLPGFLVRDAETRLSIAEVDGSKVENTARAQVPFRITQGFAPLQAKVSLGGALTPINRKAFRATFKVGAGAVQAFTQRGLRLSDDAATADVLELSRMQDYLQIGAEAKLDVGGLLFGKILSYSLTSSLMLPFFTSIDTTGKSYDQLLSFDVIFKLGIKVFRWLSINYSLGVVYTPLIQPQVQLTNNLVLSLTWSIL